MYREIIITATSYSKFFGENEIKIDQLLNHNFFDPLTKILIFFPSSKSLSLLKNPEKITRILFDLFCLLESCSLFIVEPSVKCRNWLSMNIANVQ